MVKKKLNKVMTKSRLSKTIKQRYGKNQGCLEKKIEFKYDKNQGYREKLNYGMTKTKVDKKKTKQRYDQNQGYREKLNKV